MSMRDYERALALIEQIGGGDLAGPKPEALVVRVEEALGLRLPPTYRRFLREMGCGDINGVEIYGLIHDDFERSSVPDGIWVTLTKRKTIALNSASVIVGSGGDGTSWFPSRNSLRPYILVNRHC